MKKISIIIAIVTFSACNSSSKNKGKAIPTEQNQIVYTCTMHPEIETAKPGICPKCGMQLVEKEN